MECGRSFIQSARSRQRPDLLFIWTLFCSDKPQFLLRHHSLIGEHGDINNNRSDVHVSHKHAESCRQRNVAATDTTGHTMEVCNSQNRTGCSCFQCLCVMAQAQQLPFQIEKLLLLRKDGGFFSKEQESKAHEYQLAVHLSCVFQM